MHPRQASLISTASDISEKLAKAADKKQSAGAYLWKYTDPEGHEFYLKEKKMTVRSPYSGKSFTAKPERENPGGVAKELREDAKADSAPAGAGPGAKSTGKRKKADWKA